MTDSSLSFKSSVIHYRYGGHGPLPLICFHGYGESSKHFDFLEKQLGSTHHIIAIDMPFHGSTTWNDKFLLPQDLPDIINEILHKHQLQNSGMQLLGFSMGGRIALCVLEQMPSHVSKLVLLAPDGLTVNFWHWLSTQTTGGNRLFKFTMAKPEWFMGLLRVSNKMRLINPSIFKFVEYYINDKKVRKALYDRWTALSKCSPDLKKIRNIIRSKQVSVRLLYGKYDRIIGSKKGTELIKDLPGCHIEILDCGHQVLHEKNAAAIANALLH